MRTTLIPILFLVSASALSCGGSLPHPRYMAQPSTALAPVPLPPPPARVETVPPSPASGAVWVDGEWVYKRGRWGWRLGQWVVPQPETFFSPWTEVRVADGTLLHAPGVWRDAKGQVTVPPSPLAIATAQAGPVVDAEGVTETTGRTVKPEASTQAAPPASPEPPPPASPAPTTPAPTTPAPTTPAPTTPAP